MPNLIHDPSKVRLGKRPRRHDPRTLRMSAYINRAALPPLPVEVDWSKPVGVWGMHLNDNLGCCTIAGLANAVQTWTANAGKELIVPDADVLKAYEQWDGYNPADPSTDLGGIELDVLNDFRQQGFSGVTLDAFTATKIARADIQVAIWLFGGAYIGVELPIAAQNEEVWDVSENPGPDDTAGSWGGHAVWLVKYDAQGPSCVTWGALKKMTWAWLQTYCDEAYALLSKSWIEASGIAPDGIAFDALSQDLKVVSA